MTLVDSNKLIAAINLNKILISELLSGNNFSKTVLNEFAVGTNQKADYTQEELEQTKTVVCAAYDHTIRLIQDEAERVKKSVNGDANCNTCGKEREE